VADAEQPGGRGREDRSGEEGAVRRRYDPATKKRFLAPDHPAEDALLMRNFGVFMINSIPPEFYQEGNPYRRWVETLDE